MYLLGKQPTNAEVFAFCEQWLAHLAHGDYAAARALLRSREPQPWTPELIEQLIANYGSYKPRPSGIRYQVTPPESTPSTPLLERRLQSLRPDPDEDTCTGEVHERYPFAICWYLDGPSRRGAVGWVHIDYPLNGEWSDLSSIFDLMPHGDGLGFDLERIEVM
jgi:hypothetical protein